MKDRLQKNNPIAVFDSGVGGISVLRELIRIMPWEDYLYFGDSKNAPYGMKEKERVCELTCMHAKHLFELGAKGLVVACNTATSAAVKVLREKYPRIPIVGIEPAVKPAVLSKEHPKVLVMATPMTIREEKFLRLVERFECDADIIPLSCPGLMDFVERGDLDGEDLKKYLRELLYDFRNDTVDAVVLGCTHYPFVGRQIKETLGEHVQIFDGGAGTAREMQRRLKESDLLIEEEKEGKVLFERGLMEEEKILLCQKLLSLPIF